MRVIGFSVLTMLFACAEEEPKTEELSLYCGESEGNNLIVEDEDCDGTVTADDCDDNDPDSLTVAEDGDCDEVLTADDCDDTDGSDASLSGDCDDDGYGQAVDCDDNDSESTFTGIDADCDGTITADDCDDNDPMSLTTADDADCDGVLTIDDCDDTDAVSTTMAEDGDCDGVLTTDDCDDNDSASLTRFEDGDCDGTLTVDDCDDSDATSTVVVSDMDCDGALDAEECDAGAGVDTDTDGDCDDDGYGQSVDCDDNDATSTFIAIDADCDGTITADDCDDNDPMSLTTADDADCDGALDIDECDAGTGVDTDTDGDCDDDGVLAVDDCDDDDSTLLEVVFDGDCDGVQTPIDCNDSDPLDVALSGDCDQDGVNALVDCDDTDSGLGSTVLDNDCDGVLTVDDCDDSDNTDAALSGDCDQDGVVTTDDCDDTDTAFGDIAFDTDCDGVIDPVCAGGLEPEQDSALCYIDVDEDGYGDNTIVAGPLSPGCYFIEIAGETWGFSSADMHNIIGYEDGVIELWLEHDHYASTPDYEYESQSTTYCPDPTTNLVELAFTNGYGIAQYEVYYDNGRETEFITSGTHSMGDHTILSESWPTTNTMDAYGTDCDDTDPYTHPGAADLDSTTACLTDADGDGYGEYAVQACYQLTFMDGNYLGWDGNTIGILEDGVLSETFVIDEMEGLVTHQYCAALGTQQVDFVFNEASSHSHGWFGTTDFTLAYQTDSGTSTIGTGGGTGSNTQTFNFSGSSFTDGEIFFSESVPFTNGLSTGGTDCDDTDVNIGSSVFDADCDGVSTGVDCDDSDPSNTMSSTNDADCDGVLTADDCNDNDAYTYHGAAYNEPDVNGDNIIDCTRDVDGDGYATSVPEQCLEFTMSAYDIDSSDGHGIAVFVDGYLEDVVYFDEDVASENLCVTGTDLEFVVMSYGTDLGNTFAGASGTIENATGTISESFSANINSETDLTFNGMSYGPGETFYTVTPVESYELGTDCDDTSDATYPGAAYNETGVLTSECLEDADGDGYGAENLIACYEVQMENATNAVNGWPSSVYIEALVDTGLGVYSSTNFQMGPTDGSSKTESLCVPEGTYVEFRYQAGSIFSTLLRSVYAEIVEVTGTTEVTMSGIHNSNIIFLQTMRKYTSSSGSYSLISDGDLLFSDFSSPASTNIGGTDADDGNGSIN